MNALVTHVKLARSKGTFITCDLVIKTNKLCITWSCYNIIKNFKKKFLSLLLNSEELLPKEQGTAVTFNIKKLSEGLLSETFRIMRRLQLRSSFFLSSYKWNVWISTKLNEIKENVVHCVQSALKKSESQIV